MGKILFGKIFDRYLVNQDAILSIALSVFETTHYHGGGMGAISEAKMSSSPKGRNGIRTRPERSLTPWKRPRSRFPTATICAPSGLRRRPNWIAQPGRKMPEMLGQFCSVEIEASAHSFAFFRVLRFSAVFKQVRDLFYARQHGSEWTPGAMVRAVDF